ncbi:MAG: tRNA (adenine57-N1/adenine58-N1)-methyltransferase catalytic subunit [Streptosporangiaceae bacterium]|nr:tRNA (adenine57-N1/adenine58-N1)-methyltransferase catalytic subunit [Streptosporangiaceae bacterium]
MIRQRRGPFAPGDQVQLTDPKGRKHLVLLAEGRTFHTHRGGLAHDDLIGAPEGTVVKSSGGTPYVALRPLLADFTLSMSRGAAVVYPKDAAQIIALADIFPGARVLEAGAGSGALSCWLLRSVGEDGLLVSYERRADFAAIARDNVERFFGGPHPAWQLRIGDLMEITGGRAEAAGQAAPDITGGPPEAPAPAAPDVTDGPAEAAVPAVPEVTAAPPDHAGPADSFDRVVLDMLAPWEFARVASDALIPGGVLCCYVATVTQLSRTVESIREQSSFDEPVAWESLVRGWHADGLAVRPEHRMVGHTGFLITARRLAQGITAPPRRRRPAKGSREESDQ